MLVQLNDGELYRIVMIQFKNISFFQDFIYFKVMGICVAKKYGKERQKNLFGRISEFNIFIYKNCIFFLFCKTYTEIIKGSSPEFIKIKYVSEVFIWKSSKSYTTLKFKIMTRYS